MTDSQTTPDQTIEDAFYVINAHKMLLIRIRDELTMEIEKLICLEVNCRRTMTDD